MTARAEGPARRVWPRRHGAFFWGLALITALAGVGIFYPLMRIVVFVFGSDQGLSLASLRQLILLPGLGWVVINTGILVGAAGGLAVVVALVLALLNERTNARIGVLAGILPIMPLLVPSIAGVVGWTFLLSPVAGFINVALRAVLPDAGEQGPFSIFGWTGLILLSAINLIPYAYLIIAAALRNVDSDLEEASRVSGRGTWHTLLHVSVPAILPAIGNALFICVIVAVALFSVPAVIGTRANIEVLSVRIVTLLTASYPPKTNLVVMLGFGMMLFLAMLSLLQGRIARHGHVTMGGKHSARRLMPLGRMRLAVRIAVLFYVLLSSVLPFCGLVLVSLQPYWSPDIFHTALDFRNYRSVLFTDALVAGALQRSLLLGLAAGIVGIAVAVAMVLFANEARGLGRRIVGFIVQVPGALSHIVIAIGVILALSGRPFNLAGSFGILLIAYLIMYIPQCYGATSSAFRQLGTELTEASRVSGAARLRTLFLVEVPLMGGGLAAAWTMMFVLAMNDLTASTMLTDTRNGVMGSTILALYDTGTYPQLAALATVMTLVSAGMVGLVARVQAGFR